jgi:hypothetical protein
MQEGRAIRADSRYQPGFGLPRDRVPRKQKDVVGMIHGVVVTLAVSSATTS